MPSTFSKASTLAWLSSVGLMALSPSLGWAVPVPGTPYSLTHSFVSMELLSSPTVLWTSTDDGTRQVSLPFPFRFYDQSHSDISIDANGAVSLPGGQRISYTNQAPGSSSAPNGFIAAFWDDLQLYAINSGSIGYQTIGVAPQRIFVVEYRRISRRNTSGYTFDMQIRLHEGPAGRIEIDYGNASGTSASGWSATMGLEDQNGGRPIYLSLDNCATNCGASQLAPLLGVRTTLVQDRGPEIFAVALQTPARAAVGAPISFNTTIQSMHGSPMGPFEVVWEAARDHLFSQPIFIGQQNLSLAPFETYQRPVSFTLPTSLTAGRYFMRMRVDSSNTIAEADESNNQAISPQSILVLPAKADLSVERVQVSGRRFQAGQMVQVFAEITNRGGVAAAATPVAALLSSNQVVSAQDSLLGQTMVTLAPGQSTTATLSFSLPQQINSGSYYLGVLADPQNNLDELSESNNGRVAFRPIQVEGTGLSILTQRLPAAYLHQSYAALLTAIGADGQNSSWKIVQGQLPQGISLLEATGEFYGRPSQTESQTFMVELSSGGQKVTQNLTLEVIDAKEPLTIVSRSLATAQVGLNYSFQLVFTGGAQTSSVSWKAAGLPEGLSISPEGLLSGVPSTPGTFDVDVQVNSGNENAQRPLRLQVIESDNLLISPVALAVVSYGLPYEHTFQSQGGVAPIIWSVQQGQLPEGLELTPEGVLKGTAVEVGHFRIVVEAQDSAPTRRRARDSNAYDLKVVEVGDSFQISTDALELGKTRQSYRQTISAMGGTPPYEWQLIAGVLPLGIRAQTNLNTNDFDITGQTEEIGTYNLLVEVTDSRGRKTKRAFALRMQEPDFELPPGQPGCRCQGSASENFAPFWLLAFVLVPWALRRRRS